MSAAPLLILAAGIAALLALIAAKRAYLPTSLATAAILLAALASIPGALAHPATFPLLTFDSLSLGFTALILASALLILIIAHAYLQPALPVPREEFFLLLLLATLGACALACANNFISLFLGLETMTLATIGLIAYPRHRPAAEEAGVKYLILSGLTSAILLFGIGLITLAQGSLDLANALAAPATPILLTGFAMVAIAAAFKLSVVPFHIWVPDVYAGAPAPSGAYLAVVAKIAVLAILIRAAPAALTGNIVNAITLIAILSMLIGNLLALLQDNTKRLLGYSSIAHLGYLLVAILAAGAIGRIAVIFYIVTYAITMIAAFGTIAVLSAAAAATDLDKSADLRGLFWTRPTLAAILTLSLLSLAGIPPAIGFIAKMYIFAAGIHTDLWALITTMVASSVIGLFYYLNLIMIMSQKPTAAAPAQTSLPGRLALALVSLPMLGFGIAPQPLIALLKIIFG